jgi:ActR/RegA family two-component response regulator
MNGVVLIVDDSTNIQADLGTHLQRMGYKVLNARTIDEAIKVILGERLDYAIIDLKIDYKAEFGGVQIVNFVKRRQPQSRAIVLSAYELDDRIKTRFDVEYDAYISKGGSENYILAVLNRLDDLDKRKPTKTCFVIMPFSATPSCREDQWTEIYKNLFRPAIEDSGYDFMCKRSEALHGNIIEDILDHLNRADIVLADLTDRNPNVFYELA